MEVDEIHRYKSGKRKGEIKEIKPKMHWFYRDDPHFIELTSEKDVDRLVYEDDTEPYWYNKKEAELYACPKCGTVIVKGINENDFAK